MWQRLLNAFLTNFSSLWTEHSFSSSWQHPQLENCISQSPLYQRESRDRVPANEMSRGSNWLRLWAKRFKEGVCVLLPSHALLPTAQMDWPSWDHGGSCGERWKEAGSLLTLWGLHSCTCLPSSRVCERKNKAPNSSEPLLRTGCLCNSQWNASR